MARTRAGIKRQDGAQPRIYEDRLTIMIDDGKVPLFAQQGCRLGCHNGQRDMLKQFTNDEVKANPLLTATQEKRCAQISARNAQ